MSSPSGSLAALSHHLPELTWFDPFFVSWVLGFVEAMFSPTEPLLLLFVPILLWVWLESSIHQAFC